jgi:hypothetical protein
MMIEEQSTATKIVSTMTVGMISLLCPLVMIWSCVSLAVMPFAGPRGTLLHTITSPDQQLKALVFSDGCGITCGCTVRVDLETRNHYLTEIFRGIDVCDVEITWVDNRVFTLRDNNGQHRSFDVRILHQAP